jgi:SAM-dependent methyltransferase
MKSAMVAKVGPQHWNSMAEFWAQLGSPLRPCVEDQAGYRSFIFPWLERFAQPRAIILGVTPELYHLGWPANVDLIAVDRARVMIEEVWPGPRERAFEGDWLQLQLPPHSREVCVCDGGLILLDYPEGHRALVAQLRELLVPGGRCLFRLFVPPLEQESVARVLGDLLSGGIPNLNVLKLRLAMAMQESPAKGVPVQDILRVVKMLDRDVAELAQRLGWSYDHLRAIEAYRNSPARYCFPTEAEITRIFLAEGGFTFLGRSQGTYPLSERCPVVAFARSPG